MNNIVYATIGLFLVLLNACTFSTNKADDDASRMDSISVTGPIEIDSFYYLQEHNIEEFFIKKAKSKRFSGTYLFAKDGVVFAKGAIGLKDYAKKDSLTVRDPFQLASVSKPLTAIGVLKLIDQGKLSLDDSIQKFIPGFPYKGITVRLLLSHRHGLPNYMYFSDKYWLDRHTPISNDDVIKLFVDKEPSRYYMPDRRYNYSNSGYALLASIIEKVSKKTYAQFMEQDVFRPTHMRTAKVFNLIDAPEVYDDNVKGHLHRRKKAGTIYLDGVVGDKGVYASVYDLFALDSALHHGFLSDSIQGLSFIEQHKDLRNYDNYGLGWRLNVLQEDNRLIWHSGWWKGFKTYYLRLVDQNLVIIVLTNRLNRFLNKTELIELVDSTYQSR